MIKTRHIFLDVKNFLDENLKSNPPKNLKYDLKVFYNLISYIEQLSMYTEEEHVRISQRNLTNFLNISKETLNKYIKYLISIYLIHRTSCYNISEKEKISYGYKFCNEVIFTTFEKYCYSYESETGLKEFNLNDVGVKYTFDNISNLKVDLNSAIKKLNNLYFNEDISMRKCKSSSNGLYDLAIGKYFISRGKDSDRIYSSFTGISKRVSEFVYFKGKQLSEIDAKSSQLLILSYLTRNVKSDFHKIVKEQDFYIWMLDRVSNLLKDSDKEYVVYNSKLKRVGEYLKPEMLTRDFIKGEVYKSMFSFFGGNSCTTRIFKKFFTPVIDEFYTLLNNYNQTNCIEISPAAFLQRFEAGVFINAFIELNDNGIECFTKHDSICFLSQDYTAVLECLIKHYALNGMDDIKDFLKEKLYYKTLTHELEPVKIYNIEQEFKTLKTQVESDKLNFYNKKTKEFFNGTKVEFIEKFNLLNSSVNRLILGNAKSYLSWIVV